MEEKDVGRGSMDGVESQGANPQPPPPSSQGQPYAQTPPPPNPQDPPYAQAPPPSPQGQPYAQAPPPPNPQGQPYAQAPPPPNPQSQPYAQAPPPGYYAYAPPPVPREVRRWNWGAFMYNWIWGCSNGAYLALLTLVPILGWFVWPFVCGALGNTWAWKSGKFKDLETFLTVQKTWNIAGIITFVITVVFIVIEIISFVFLVSTPWDGMLDSIDSYTDYGDFGSDLFSAVLP